jgi:hypothetical protein
MTLAIAKKETKHPMTEVSVQTAARILRTSERGVLRLIERGEIAARVIGRSGLVNACPLFSQMPCHRKLLGIKSYTYVTRLATQRFPFHSQPLSNALIGHLVLSVR